MPDKVIRNSISFSKVRHCPDGCNPDGATSIALLAMFGNKTAVLWTVISVYVFTFQSQFIGVAVGKSPVHECCEIQPFGMNFDAAATVMFEVEIIGVSASLLHPSPDLINSGWSAVGAAGISMFSVSFCSSLLSEMEFCKSSLFSQASTGIRPALQESVNSSPNLISAFASTEPFGSKLALCSKRCFAERSCDCEVSEYLIG